MYKYLIALIVPEPFTTQLRQLMDKIESVTHIESPYKRLPPHITLHRPITGVDEQELKDMIRRVVSRMLPTHVELSGPSPFGKRFVVLPVQPTLSLAWLWVELHAQMSRLPNHKPLGIDHKNTLHVTVAEKTSQVFNRIWPEIKKLQVKPISKVPVETVYLYRKRVEEQIWEEVSVFPFRLSRYIHR